MRGKRISGLRTRDADRITPADAGKTPNAVVVQYAEWDHPRGCGENDAGKILFAVALGSPPRMRGKQRFDAADKLLIRITPADAGKTLSAALP